MNSHLNIFRTYTNTHRTFQLENDLTRAFAISLQEDSLFFFEVIREVMGKSEYYEQLFNSPDIEQNISIDIQKTASSISSFDHIFALTLSDTEIGDFWNTKSDRSYDPICDLVIRINNIILIIEAKRDNIDCTSQLYNQVHNIIRSNSVEYTSLNEKIVTPFDLNWSKLMAVAIRILNFEQSFGNTNRFLSDFVSLVKDHNYKWLPETPINLLQYPNKNSILRRIDSAIIEASKIDDKISKLNYNGRIGITLRKDWTQEILFGIDDIGNLIISTYPGNTKAQGITLFNTTPSFNGQLEILGQSYEVEKKYHIKFSSFQRYFTGLWFNEKDLFKPLYTANNFKKYTGRKKRGKQWEEIETVLNEHLNFDWQKQCKWQDLVINSGKNQFDISFGFEFYVKIPFLMLKSLDKKPFDIENLVGLIKDIHRSFNDTLLKTV